MSRNASLEKMHEIPAVAYERTVINDSPYFSHDETQMKDAIYQLESVEVMSTRRSKTNMDEDHHQQFMTP